VSAFGAQKGEKHGKLDVASIHTLRSESARQACPAACSPSQQRSASTRHEDARREIGKQQAWIEEEDDDVSVRQRSAAPP